MAGRPGHRRHLGEPVAVRAGISRVDDPVGDARRAEEPAVDLLLAEFDPSRPVFVGWRVRLEVEQRRAKAAHGKPELRIESAHEVG